MYIRLFLVSTQDTKDFSTSDLGKQEPNSNLGLLAMTDINHAKYLSEKNTQLLNIPSYVYSVEYEYENIHFFNSPEEFNGKSDRQESIDTFKLDRVTHLLDSIDMIEYTDEINGDSQNLMLLLKPEKIRILNRFIY